MSVKKFKYKLPRTPVRFILFHLLKFFATEVLTSIYKKLNLFSCTCFTSNVVWPFVVGNEYSLLQTHHTLI